MRNNILNIKLSIFTLLMLLAFGVSATDDDNGDDTATPELTVKSGDTEDNNEDCKKYPCRDRSWELTVPVGQYVALPNDVTWRTLEIERVELSLKVLDREGREVATYSSGQLDAKTLVGRRSSINTYYDFELGEFTAVNRQTYRFDYTFDMYAVGARIKTSSVSSSYTVLFDNGDSWVGVDPRSSHRKSSNVNGVVTKESVTMYPNPAKDVLNIALPSNESSINVKVFNILGEEVRTLTLKSEGGSYKLNLQNTDPGVYFVKVTQGTWSIQKRFVKI